VIGGLIYNSMTFMILPLYVSRRRIDPRLLEASKDLYSTSFRAFRRIILPLSIRVCSQEACWLFIPAMGDFHQCRLSGQHADHDDRQRYSESSSWCEDYPGAAALSFLLMAMILVGVLSYTRALGTEDLV